MITVPLPVGSGRRGIASRVRARSAAAATLAGGSVAGLVIAAAPAWAHVHAVSPGAVRGSIAIVTFEVPNESQTGSATTELTVTLPDVASARTEAKSGWTVRLERDAVAGAVRSVTWTAVANQGIGVDQFGLFRISMKLPDVDSVHFPAAQRYADGTVVRWDQPALPGGGEPERPVPTLTLAPGPVAPPEHHATPTHPAPSVSASARPKSSAGPDSAAGPVTAVESPSDRIGAASDNPARLLAGVALLVAALGLTIAITRRRT